MEEKAKWPDSILLPTLNRKLLLKQPPPCNQGWKKIKGTFPQGLSHVGKSNSMQEYLSCFLSARGIGCSLATKNGCQNALLAAHFCMPEAEGCPQTWVSSGLDGRKRPSLAQSCSRDVLWPCKSFFVVAEHCCHYTRNRSINVKTVALQPRAQSRTEAVIRDY